MSGGEKKKRASKAHGWEEAKDEFYQESYPTDMMDFEALERDPRKITTLLPSQQNRATTYNRKFHHKDPKNKNTIKRTATMTVRRQSVVQDNYVAMMPDLSENLSNERTTWEEIMKIKDMPIGMSQKKEQKAKLQSATKLRLQGYEQFKWQRRKMFQSLKSQWKETYSKLELWKYSLKQIEGHYGTGVVTYFQFIKWLMFLNLSIFLTIFKFTVFPAVVSDLSDDLFGLKMEKLFCRETNSLVGTCSSNYTNSTDTSKIDVFDILQGTGWMEDTYMFYGKYDCSLYNIPYSSYFYNLPLAYVLVTICVFIMSLVAIVKSAAQGFRDRLLEGEGQFYQYCNLVFGGWDFCIQNEKAANMKHKALFNEIKSNLMEEKRKEEKKQRSGQIKTKLLIVRTVVNVIVLLVLSGCGTLIYFAIDYQTKNVDDENNEWIEKLLLQYLPSIAIIGLNTIVPFVFSHLITYEHYSPMFSVKITLLRTIFLRLASLLVLLASIYTLISCRPYPQQCVSDKCNTPLCWETYAGQQIYRLFLLDFVAHVLITFFLNFPRMLIAKHCKSRIAKKIGEQEFDLPKHVLDIVYSQALCWLGMYFSPLLPGLATVELFLMFYVKKFACLVNSNPGSVVHFASRSKSLFMTILLLAFIVAVTPVGLSIAEIKPSISCGPFRGEETVWAVVTSAFETLPNAFKSVIFYFATAGFAVPAFIILTLSLYYFFAVSQANKHMVAVLKNQLVLEGHDKQFLLNRLSAFIKQQQELNRKQARNVAASGDVNSITDNSNASQSVH